MNMNNPYVKQYDDNGILSNPIVGSYATEFPQLTRTDRRLPKQKKRFFGNGKQIPLVVGGKFKYLKVLQYAFNKEGNLKTIEHYILQ
jgi:hypothetical protein